MLLFFIIIIVNIEILYSKGGFRGRYDREINLKNQVQQKNKEKLNDGTEITLDDIKNAFIDIMTQGNIWPHAATLSEKPPVYVDDVWMDTIDKLSHKENTQKWKLTDAELLAVTLYTDTPNFRARVDALWSLEAIQKFSYSIIGKTGNQEMYMLNVEKLITALYRATHKEYAKIYFKGEPISVPTYFVDLYEIVNTALINLGDKIDSSYDLITNKDLNYFSGFILTVSGHRAKLKYNNQGVTYKIEYNEQILHEYGALEIGVLDVKWITTTRRKLLIYNVPSDAMKYEAIYSQEWNKPNSQQIRDLVTFTKYLATNQVIHQQVADLVSKIWQYLHIRYKADDIKQRFSKFFDYNKAKGAAGFIDYEQQYTIFAKHAESNFKNANIRELMNLIWEYSTSRYRCLTLWQDIKELKQSKRSKASIFINDKYLQQRLKTFESEIGYSYKELMTNDYLKNAWNNWDTTGNKGNIICKQTTLKPPGPAKFARDAKNEYFETEFRMEDAQHLSHCPLIEQIVPKLSKYEKDWIIHKNFMSPTSRRIHWATGYQRYFVSTRSISTRMAFKYKRGYVSGISSSAPLLLDVARQFKDINMPLMLGAVVIYLGNAPQHSLSEILLGISTPNNEYFTKKYDIKEYPYQWLQDIMKTSIKIKIPHQQQILPPQSNDDNIIMTYARHLSYLDDNNNMLTLDNQNENQLHLHNNNNNNNNNNINIYISFLILFIFVVIFCGCIWFIFGIIFAQIFGSCVDDNKNENNDIYSV